MKILVVGGGSGGHITPAVAVVREILKNRPRTRIEFWTDFKYYKNVTKLTTEIGMAWGREENNSRKYSYIRVKRIPAGKWHRYSGWRLKDYFIRFDLTFKDLIIGNILGFFGFIAGIIVSFQRLLIKKNRPDVIFFKGGFVCLPVGIIAKIFRIPYVVHESDAVPGLANRLLMKKAKIVAFGISPSDETLKEHLNYVWTGVPVGEEFKEVSATKQKNLKKAFGFSSDKPLVVVTGGSQGSHNINQAIRDILPDLLKFTSVGLVAGRTHYEDMVDLKRYENWNRASLESDFRLWEFNTAMDELMGAADIIVSRAGATTIAEVGALKKAMILIPFAPLPGGHQVKNADRLAKLGAVRVVPDEKMTQNPTILLDEIRTLSHSPRKRSDMASALYNEVHSNAAEKLAEIILGVSSGE